MDPPGGRAMEPGIGRYTCSICGVTEADTNQWGPVCRKTGARVCAECCWKCQDHVSWSGIWDCSFITDEQKKALARKRSQERFDKENREISAAYHKHRKEEAKKRAIKAAKARAKASQENR